MLFMAYYFFILFPYKTGRNGVDNASDVDSQVVVALNQVLHFFDWLSHVLGQLIITYFEYAFIKIFWTKNKDFMH